MRPVTWFLEKCSSKISAVVGSHRSSMATYAPTNNDRGRRTRSRGCSTVHSVAFRSTREMSDRCGFKQRRSSKRLFSKLREWIQTRTNPSKTTLIPTAMSSGLIRRLARRRTHPVRRMMQHKRIRCSGCTNKAIHLTRFTLFCCQKSMNSGRGSRKTKIGRKNDENRLTVGILKPLPPLTEIEATVLSN